MFNFKISNLNILIIGSGISQAIPIIIAPFITRVFSPEEFGAFSLIISWSMIFAVVSTGRFELAIALPRLAKNAVNIALIAIIYSLIFFLISWFTLILVSKNEIVLHGQIYSLDFVHWVPLISFFLGLYQIIYYFNIRNSRFPFLAKAKVLQSSVAGCSQLSMGLLKFSTLGLILGQIGGLILSLWYLVRSSDIRKHLTINNKSLTRLWWLAKRYKKFPLILSPSHMIGSLSPLIPIIYIGIFYNAAAAGFVALVQRVVGLPLVIIGGSFGDIFKQKAGEEYRAKGNCKDTYDSTLRQLILVSFAPFILFYLSAPVLFPLIFGVQWAVAGEYAQALIPMYFFRFISSPLSFMYMIAEKQFHDFWLQIAIVTVSVSSFVFTTSITSSLNTFSFGYSIIYIVNIAITRHFSRG